MNPLHAAHPRITRRALALALAASVAFGIAGAARAHGAQAGDIVIDHPYALPTPDAARNGAAYFRGLRNTGPKADRLLAASAPVAASVEIHRSTMDGNVMRMRALESLELPAGQEVKLRHGGELHVMLMGLKQPLKVGDRFPLKLRFEHAGEVEVTVWVQQPKAVDVGHTH